MNKSTAGGHPVPMFVVEIISEHDKANKIEKKAGEYFQPGVQVVRHVYAELGMVRVLLSLRSFSSPFDADVVDTAPAVSDSQLTVDTLLAL